eukprot:gene8341-9240_t
METATIYELVKNAECWILQNEEDPTEVNGEAWDHNFEKVPELPKTEIRMAIKQMKNNKAVGLDGILAPALKAGLDTCVEKHH